MTKGGRESKMPGYGNFQSVPRYRKGTDQSGIFDSLHPFCHTNSEPSGHKIHQDPCTWGKNTWKQLLFKFWAIVGHSVRGGGPLLQNYVLEGLPITIFVGTLF